jgi:alkanesulfonate monooxygenase SsuD/methylene tetrahydromethanopterin reductase-like flavin-dependent oxidoreductase (luciferase family)
VPGPRQPRGTAFAIRDPLPWTDLEALVRAAEQTGYVALFLPEIQARDATVTLGALAGSTRDLLLGTGILPMRSRTPVLTAMASATVQERSNGRFVLGLGTGPRGRASVLDELRDIVTQVRGLLAGDEVERKGRRTRLALRPDPPPPIWISALGPKAMRLAGEVADGVLLNWCPPERVGYARERVAEGAAAAGRDPSEIPIGVYVRAWVGEDRDAAIRALKEASGRYASYAPYARQLEQVGLGGLGRAAAEASLAGRVDDVPEALLEAVCAVGDAASGRLEVYREAGADLVVVYPVAAGDPATSLESTLLALAPG